MKHTPQSRTYSEVRAGPHTLWIDNFSKNSGYQIPDLAKGVFASSLWTGSALKQYPHNIDLRPKLNDDGDMIPIMPDDPFVHALRLQRVFNTYIKQPQNPMMRHATSMVAKWQVNNVPLKPKVLKVPDKYKEAVTNSYDSLKDFYPEKIVEHNIGSNEGLSAVMRQVYDESVTDVDPQERRYRIINADCNIFDRCIKVMAQLVRLFRAPTCVDVFPTQIWCFFPH